MLQSYYHCRHLGIAKQQVFSRSAKQRENIKVLTDRCQKNQRGRDTVITGKRQKIMGKSWSIQKYKGNII